MDIILPEGTDKQGEAHAMRRCCCKWHGSACCYDQLREAERRMEERLENYRPGGDA